MAKVKRSAPVPAQDITRSILVLRRHRVLLDTELATLYGVTTKRLNEQVKRNAERFPEDFLLRLTRPEVEALNRSQFAAGSQKHRDPRFPPFAFTEHGAIMAAAILYFFMAEPCDATHCHFPPGIFTQVSVKRSLSSMGFPFESVPLPIKTPVAMAASP